MDAADLIDPDTIEVEPPLWFIGKPDDPKNVARVLAAQGAPDGPEAAAALLFTDADLAEQALAEHFGGWEVGRLDGRQDVLAYLHLAQSRGLEFVAFDPGSTFRIYSIVHIIDLLTEGS